MKKEDIFGLLFVIVWFVVAVFMNYLKNRKQEQAKPKRNVDLDVDMGGEIDMDDLPPVQTVSRRPVRTVDDILREHGSAVSTGTAAPAASVRVAPAAQTAPIGGDAPERAGETTPHPILAELASPQGMARAILLSEIIRRPEERWQ